MSKTSRRGFLKDSFLATSAAATAKIVPSKMAAGIAATPLIIEETTEAPSTPVDFRFAPRVRQTALCFPDDPSKSLTDEAGRLLYGYDSKHEIDDFTWKVGFGLNGMQPPRSVEQSLEAAGIPILATVHQWDDVILTMTAFATDRPDEGRYDNVLLQCRGRSGKDVVIEPAISIFAPNKFKLEQHAGIALVTDDATQKVLLFARINNGASAAAQQAQITFTDNDAVTQVVLHAGRVSNSKTYEAFVRLPLPGAAAGVPRDMEHPENCLAAARAFWKGWQAFRAPASWTLNGRQSEFLTACARNILQAREVQDGRLTFQVGPTCYRGLWIVDGNFILEAARYLGHDKEALEGLRSTWSKQQQNGQLLAGGGAEHWKDTAIALFTLVRQCD